MINPPAMSANPMKYEDTAFMHRAPKPTPVAAVMLQIPARLCSFAISHEPTAIVARLRKMITLLVTIQFYDVGAWILGS
jgi:hypothetical protein